ncbi:MAG: hypothetical protein AAGE52_03135 [Myxococcota bacterium]
MGRIARILGLEPGEGGAVARMALVYGAIGASTTVADTLVQSAFLARAGAEALPYVLGARAVLSPALAWTYSRTARRRSSRGVLSVIALLNAVAIAGARVALDLGPVGATAAYAVHEIASALLTLHWGVYLLDHFRPDAAKRAVAPIYAGARGAAVIGGVFVALGAPAFGGVNALYVAAALYVVTAALAFLPSRLHRWRAGTRGQDARRVEAARAPQGDADFSNRASDDDAEALLVDAEETIHAERAARKRGWSLLRQSPLLGTIAVATIAMVFVRITLRYGQQSILDAIDEAALAALLGWYAAAANAISIALQLMVTGRLLQRIGVGATNALYAGATLVTQGALWFFGASLPSALAARFTESELKHALKTPVSPLFYQGFFGADRFRARSFVLGLISPAANLAGALALGLLVRAPDLVAPIGFGVALGYVLVSLAQGRAYRQATQDVPLKNSSD